MFNELSLFLSHSCELFCVNESQPFSFQSIPHSLHKTPGVGVLRLPSSIKSEAPLPVAKRNSSATVGVTEKMKWKGSEVKIIEGATAVKLVAPSKLSRKVSDPPDSFWRRTCREAGCAVPNGIVKATSFAVQVRGASAVKLAAPSKLSRKVLKLPVQSARKISLRLYAVNQIRMERLCISVDACAKSRAQKKGLTGSSASGASFSGWNK
jgi:hypothetical protein